MARCEAEAFERRAPRRPKNLDATEWEAPEPLDGSGGAGGVGLVALQTSDPRVPVRPVDEGGRGAAATACAMLRMGNIRDGRWTLSELKYVDRQGIDVPGFTRVAGRHPVQPHQQRRAGGQGRGLRRSTCEAVFASYLVRLELRRAAGLQPLRLRLDQLPLGPPVGAHGAHRLRNQSNINVSS